jgi:flagellar biosynthetic protein FliR
MLGNLLNIVLLVVFFGVDGHHRLIEIVYLTIEKIPIGSLGFSPGIGMAALEAFAMTFMLGCMVAMPVIASGLVLEICFGLLVRTVPQLNMFVVGVPVKILVGFVVLIFTLPVFMNFSGRIFSEMFVWIEKMFSVFAGAA